MSEKIACKLTVLLALWSFAIRAWSIKYLNVNFTTKAKFCYKFSFNKLCKSWRKGNVPPAVTYQQYTQDDNLCVVSTLDEHIAQTEGWRSGEMHSQLLLSFIHTHKPVVTSAISGWLKTIFRKSVVETDTFKIYSNRSASTSKAGLQEASVESILKRRPSLIKILGKNFLI